MNDNAPLKEWQLGIVRNFRFSFRQAYDRDCRMSDREVYQIHDGISAPSSEQHDAWVLDEMLVLESPLLESPLV